MENLIKDLLDNGKRGFISKDLISLIARNEPKERGLSWHHLVREDGLDFWGIWSEEPKEGYEPIILVDNAVTEDGIGDPWIIVYNYDGEIRVTELNTDAHGCQYISKII